MRPRNHLLAVLSLFLFGLGGAVNPAFSDDIDAQALARIEAPPLGLPPVPIPADNPPSAAKIALGRKLFLDRRLSHNGTMSCAMCHIAEQGFTNNELARPIGVEGRGLRRNAPTLLNVAYEKSMFHDGRDSSLETQVVGPLVARNEMANPSIGYVIARVAALPDYDGLFEAAFDAGPSVDRVGQAIASWERSLLAAASPFDRWRYGGEEDALTNRQKAGLALFTGKAGCAACHLIGDEYALLTDHAFHDTGTGYHADEVAARDESPVPVEIAPGWVVQLDRAALRAVGLPRQNDLGRHEVTLDPADLWRFKTPSLRNVALTGPYMHDGSLRSLEAVVRFYDRGGVPHEGLDPLIQPLGLTEEEITALVAFLDSLTGDGIDELVAEMRRQAVGN